MQVDQDDVVNPA